MNKRVEELLNTKRLEFKYKQSNTTKGLYDLITKYVTPETIMVELGSFAGVSSELFALHCKQLYCVDPWLPYWEITDHEKIQTAEIQFDSMRKNYTNIVKYKMTSSDASYEFAPHSLDLVYIDSDHSSENVEKEINLWVDKIKSNGVIAGHDFNLPTVFNVVTKYFDPTFIEIFNDASWIVSIDKRINII
jgi:predicted O-methyltransferase YrrM